MKTKYIIIGIIFPVLILAISFLACFFIEPKPLVIFAGGGSVSNYLKLRGIQLKEPNGFPNSVYSNMPSGHVKSLLIEEIQRFGKESEQKHPFLYISLFNKEIVDLNIKSLNPFLYIGLSAEKIEYDSLFNSEYAQVYEYYIGKDSLAVYYVDNQQHQDTIDIDTLVKELMDTTTLYTTSGNSGTRNAYDSIFSKIGKSKEWDTIILHKANNFFENDTIPTNSMVLSSGYYPPPKYKEGNNTIKRAIITNKDTVVYKNLYVYVIGYKLNNNIYKPNSQVIDFLNELYDKKHPKEKKKDYFSEDSIWEIKSSERKSIKNIQPHK